VASVARRSAAEIWLGTDVDDDAAMRSRALHRLLDHVVDERCSVRIYRTLPNGAARLWRVGLPGEAARARLLAVLMDCLAAGVRAGTL
jgi:hypothetical protein